MTISVRFLSVVRALRSFLEMIVANRPRFTRHDVIFDCVDGGILGNIFSIIIDGQ